MLNIDDFIRGCSMLMILFRDAQY